MFGSKTSSPWLYAGGKKIAFVKQVGAKYSVRESASTGGKAKVVYTAKAKQTIGSLATSANGKKLFIGVNYPNSANIGNSKARVFTVARRKAHAFGPFYKKSQIHSMALSRDGKTLAFGVAVLGIPAKRSVVLAKVAKGGISKHIAYQGFPQNITWTANGRGITLDDSTASGWAFVNVKSGKVTEDDFTSTSQYSHPAYF